jgi:orotate phosphoribosyltransferase-like protein
MKLSSNAKNIEGENVIVIDDTMSQGKTLAEACQLLCGSYLPKTIVGLTLFSPLKSK